MIITGMVLNPKSLWKLRQLDPELYRIFQKQKARFDATGSNTMKGTIEKIC